MLLIPRPPGVITPGGRKRQHVLRQFEGSYQEGCHLGSGYKTFGIELGRGDTRGDPIRSQPRDPIHRPMGERHISKLGFGHDRR